MKENLLITLLDVKAVKYHFVMNCIFFNMNGIDIRALPKIINSIGLLLDIICAWLVAVEVFKFKGDKYHKPDGTWRSAFEGTQETDQFKKWEQNKYWYMKIGLTFLTKR